VLVATRRVFARPAGEVRPVGVHPRAALLVQRRFLDPFWE
jgi:hypothetical protein